MIDIKDLVIACFLVAIFSFFFGMLAANESTEKDCKLLGSWYYGRTTFKCEEVSK